MKNNFVYCLLIALLPLSFFSVDAAQRQPLEQTLTETTKGLKSMQQKLQTLHAALAKLQAQLQPTIDIPCTFDPSTGNITITLGGTNYTIQIIPQQGVSKKPGGIFTAIKQKFDQDPDFKQKLEATGHALLTVKCQGWSGSHKHHKWHGHGHHWHHHGHHHGYHGHHGGHNGHHKNWIGRVLMAIRDKSQIIDIPCSFDPTSRLITITLDGTNYTTQAIPAQENPNNPETFYNAIKQKFDQDPGGFGQKLMATGNAPLTVTWQDGSPVVPQQMGHKHKGYPHHWHHHGHTKDLYKNWRGGIFMVIRAGETLTFKQPPQTQPQGKHHHHHGWHHHGY